MRRFIIFLGLLVAVISLWAQTKISGLVTDESGEGIVGANVYLVDSYDGATTNIDGEFDFNTSEEGMMKLLITFVGFHDHTIELNLSSSHYLEISMREKIDELNAVVITAGAFDASDENKKVVMKSLDIVTTAGSTADITGALNTLPGTQTVGETGRLFVRGGDGYETKTFIDGMVVHNEYGPSAPNTPSRSRFSPFIFKGTSFSTGGYSAEYGQALSSALILDSKDEATMDRTDLSIMTVGGDVAHTQSWDRGSVSAKLGYTNLSPYFWVVKQRVNWHKAPEEGNANFAIRQRTGEAGIVKVYGNLSYSNLQMSREGLGDEQRSLIDINNNYGYLNGIYKNAFNEKWGIKVGVSATVSQENLEVDNTSIAYQQDGQHVKVVGYYNPNDRVGLQFGSELLSSGMERVFHEELDFQQGIHANIQANHIEGQVFVSKKLAIRAGGRWEFNSLNQASSLSPRASLAYQTGKNSQVSLAAGQFYQSAREEDLLVNDQLSPEKANHWIANWQWVKDRRTFRAEAYYKGYDQLVKYEEGGYTNDGNGYARGFDLWWRDPQTINGLDYWVSYSYLDTEREYKNYPGQFTPYFASKHNLSVVAKKWISNWNTQVGTTYTLGSPRNYTDKNREGFLQAQTPAFQDFSLNASYLLNAQVIIHGMVNNLFGFDNVFGYEYANQPDDQGYYDSRPIKPAAKRFIFLGVFITLSKEKSLNQLPNL
ncbi:MAG: TonB-dependent receptor [Cyclobacteriaceae bacterium]